jgi:hypothetical protein
VTVPQCVSASLLPQRPNLFVCTSLTESEYDDFENSYPEVITFNHLKRLTWLADSSFMSTSSVRNIRMPALEYLTLYSFTDNTPTILVPAAVTLICHGVSTLQTFRLSVMDESMKTYGNTTFYRLLTLPLQHNLTTLGMQVPRHKLKTVI